jgi:hypothetical protein
VRFTADHAGTRVDLEHGGWERLADAEQRSARYSHGWDKILDFFVA